MPEILELREKLATSERVEAIDAMFRGFRAVDPTRDTNPHGYSEADVPRLIKEVRAEIAAEHALMKDSRS